jgi:hypothetical protein
LRFVCAFQSSKGADTLEPDDQNRSIDPYQIDKWNARRIDGGGVEVLFSGGQSSFDSFCMSLQEWLEAEEKLEASSILHQ